MELGVEVRHQEVKGAEGEGGLEASLQKAGAHPVPLGVRLRLGEDHWVNVHPQGLPPELLGGDGEDAASRAQVQDLVPGAEVAGEGL